MSDNPGSPTLAKILIYPIKSLDPVELQECRVGPAGGLANDRVWALFAADGKWVNGKHNNKIYPIRAKYAPDLSSVTLSAPNDSRKIPEKTLAFPKDTEAASKWFSTYFDQPVTVRYSADGVPDDPIANGPTIVSTESLKVIAELYAGMDVPGARLRFRTSLEINSVPAFWEDQLFGLEERSSVRFRIGEVNFEGSNPCARCPVPMRDPFTGEPILGFTKIFSDYRRTHIPSWTPEARFDHYYRLATNTRVAPTESGKILKVGDTLLL
jgi:uncharacterized protein YcbX